MKKLYLLLASIAILSFCHHSAKAQWNQLEELSKAFPGGIASLGLGYHNGALYSVGTGLEGIYKSTDDGKTWTILNNANNKLPNSNRINYSDIEIIGNRIYVGQTSNNQGDIFYSEDDGQTWTIDTAGLPKSITGSGRQHVVDLWSHNGYIYVQLNLNNSYYRKLPADASWTRMKWPSAPVAFVSDGDTLFATAGAGLVYSVDNGDSWITPANNGVKDIAAAVSGLSEINGTLYMGGVDWTKYPLTNKGVMKSVDGGENWTLAGFEGEAPAMSKVVAAGSEMVMIATGSPNVVFYSTDEGKNVSKDSAGLKGDWGKLYVFNNKFYMATTKGVFKRGEVSSVKKPMFSQTKVSTYPNPFQNEMEINANTNERIKVTITDLKGRVLYSEAFQNSSIQIGTAHFLPGLYFLEVQHAHSGVTLSRKKIIKSVH